MRFLLYRVTELIPVALLVLAAMGLLFWKNILTRRCIWVYLLFAGYLGVMLSLTGVPDLTHLRMGCSWNLIPFAGLAADWKNSLLNVLLFVPLGIFLPLLWEKYRSLPAAVLTGFCFSLAVELLQIFTFRTVDVNDLITNTLGTVLGFCAIRMISGSFQRFVFRDIPAGESALLPAVVLSASLLAQPVITAGLFSFNF